MLTWIKLAVRNLFRNPRRSFFTVLAIALGFVAVNVLGGFMSYIFNNLQESYIYGEANGHLTIFRTGFLDKGKLDPTRYLLTEGQLAVIQRVTAAHPEVLVTTAQLGVSGLLSNGTVSTIFVGTGRVPSDIEKIRQYANAAGKRIRQFDGQPLSDQDVNGIGVSHGLARTLNLSRGATAVAMSPTVSGQINALDAQLVQLIDSPVEVLDDKLAIVPLKFAQSLYDTRSVDRVTLLLRRGTDIEASRTSLEQGLRQSGLDVDIRTWTELSPFYTKTKKMFDVIFVVSFVIVFMIVVMSVVNTFTMAVLERTREIGTLRALGVKRQRIIALFSMESVVLGGCGSLLGIGLTLLVITSVSWLEPTWIPPQMARRVPLQIYLVPAYWMFSTLMLMLLSTCAAILPARKAARMSIPSALGYA